MTAQHNHLRKPAALSASLALTLALSAMMAGCAASPRARGGDPSLPEIDVLQLKENSDEALKLAQENKLELQSMETKVRELEGRISALGDELANLPTAKLEELGQQVALMTGQLHSLEDRIAKGPAGPAPKKDPAVFSPTALDSAGELPAPHKSPAKGDTAAGSQVKAPNGKPAGADLGPTQRVGKPAPRKPQASEAEAAIYKKAFDLYYGRDYAGAIGRFEALLKQFPASTYADNCHYWIGESRFAQGNFSKAVASFRKVFTFPDTEKSDDAQLKLGYCYLRMGDRRQAAEEFKKVVSLYPESEYTERAKEELAKLE